MKFHHVGYAVRDIRQYLDNFLVPLFAPVRVSDIIDDNIQRVRVCFVEMNGGTVIELVEPLGAGSPVDSVIGSKRGGVYHVCYEVRELESTIRRFRAKSCMPLGRPVPAAAFNQRRIVFLMTPEHDLLEFLEAPSLVDER